MTPACFFKGWPGAGPCDGALIRAHLIPKQLLRREVWNQRVALRASVEAQGRVFPASLRELVWDARCWVPSCGGLHGNGGHHGMLDHSRKLRIPRDRLPVEVEEFAREFGVLWWLDREYGEAVAA